MTSIQSWCSPDLLARLRLWRLVWLQAISLDQVYLQLDTGRMPDLGTCFNMLVQTKLWWWIPASQDPKIPGGRLIWKWIWTRGQRTLQQWDPAWHNVYAYAVPSKLIGALKSVSFRPAILGTVNLELIWQFTCQFLDASISMRLMPMGQLLQKLQEVLASLCVKGHEMQWDNCGPVERSLVR